MNRIRVFVYGTLCMGESNHGYLVDAQRVAADCWTWGELFDTGLGYPAIVSGGDNRVRGELYAVSAETLRRLDGLEGYAGPGGTNDYERVTCEVYTDEGGAITAWVYVYPADKVAGLRRIASGKWRDR